MTDLETYVVMLDRAGITHHDEIAAAGDADRPAGTTSISVDSIASDQPNAAGYGTSEHLFAPDGSLWGVWAWD
jgi:hypothetical protein